MEHVLGFVIAFAFLGAVVWGVVRLVRAGGEQQAQMCSGLMRELGIEELSEPQIARLDLPMHPTWAAAGTFLGREVVVSTWGEMDIGRHGSSRCGVRVKLKRPSDFRLQIRPTRGRYAVDEKLSVMTPGDLGLDERWNVRSTDAVLAKRIIPNDQTPLLLQVLTHEDSPWLQVGKSTVSSHSESPEIWAESVAVELVVPVALTRGRGLEDLLPKAAGLCCTIADELDEAG
ncbi:MAG: hypothetical protein JW940_16795 [Polyangiaceae bacterium]|nr:hypothetical protein [Polyangiaceae bacterium]